MRDRSSFLLVVLVATFVAAVPIAWPRVAALLAERRTRQELATRETMRVWQDALERERRRHGRYPHRLPRARRGWPSDDLPAPVDVWGRTLLYVHQPGALGDDYELRSPGPDGEAATADDIVATSPLAAETRRSLLALLRGSR